MIVGKGGILMMELLVNETLVGEQRLLKDGIKSLLIFTSGLILYMTPCKGREDRQVFQITVIFI